MKSSRILLFALTAFLMAIVIAGLVWMFGFSTDTPVGFGWFLFAFATGLSMIVLPCTLPLAFVIVPLSMGKGYVKGLATALAFGLGVAIMLSFYGILAAVLGDAVMEFSGGDGESLKNWFYAFAGFVAILFALGELGFVKFKLPSYKGAVPGFIQNRTDLFKPLLLGLFLGNIGVGCPHPATPILLARIGIEGDVLYGWLLFFTHAVGRVMPLLVLALLGIIGINATKSLMKHRAAIAKTSAWFMLFVGAFLLVLGLFTHDWWVASGQHTVFEEIVQEERFTDILRERLDSDVQHRHGVPTGTGMFGLPLWLGNWVLVGLWAIGMFGYWLRERRVAEGLGEEERERRIMILKWIGAFFITLILLLGTLLINLLPHRFQVHLQDDTEIHVDSFEEAEYHDES